MASCGRPDVCACNSVQVLAALQMYLHELRPGFASSGDLVL